MILGNSFHQWKITAKEERFTMKSIYSLGENDNRTKIIELETRDI